MELDQMIYSLSVSNDKLAELQTETKDDDELSCLTHLIKNGWPDTPKALQKQLRKYWSMKDSLSYDDGLILFGEAIVIPTSMKQNILERIHEPDLGIQKSIPRTKKKYIGMA